MIIVENHGQTKNMLNKFQNWTIYGPRPKTTILRHRSLPIENMSCLQLNRCGHRLLKCKQQHIHALITKRHNKAVWEIHKLVLSNKIARHYTLMNAWTYNKIPQENTIPTWLLTCTCDTQRCHCNARLKPDILCIIGHPYNHPHQKPLHLILPYNS